MEVGKAMVEVVKAIINNPAVQGGLGGLIVIAVVLLLLNVFGYVGNFGFTELAAHNKIRRDFADATGKQIAELANKHYWAIANAAGTLSVGLRE